MNQKQGDQNVSTEWRSELHRTQEKVNKTMTDVYQLEQEKKLLKEQVDGHFRLIRAQTAVISKFERELHRLKVLAGIFGWGFVLFTVTQEEIARRMTWQYNPSWGWQQITMAVVGLALIFYSVWGLKGEK